MDANWVWLEDDLLAIVHAEQLAEHGGGEGVRDANMLASALSRPKNQASYAKPDVAALAAAYAFGIARNHPFVDGNKRTAAVAAETFLAVNGYALDVTDAEVVVQITALAAGDLNEDELADWYRDRLISI